MWASEFQNPTPDAASDFGLGYRGFVTAAALYTGQRLGDLTSLTGRQVDLTDELIKFRSHKTGRDMVIPIAAPILDYFKRHFPKNLDAPIFPNANAVRRKSDGESRRLLEQFQALLVKAKLVKSRPTDKNSGKGHSVRRTVSELTFLSMRHITTSRVTRAEVSESVVRDIIGHESELVSRNYTHMDDERKRAAIRQLPNI